MEKQAMPPCTQRTPGRERSGLESGGLGPGLGLSSMSSGGPDLSLGLHFPFRCTKVSQMLGC